MLTGCSPWKVTKDAAQLGRVGHQRAVDHHVGIQGEKRVGVTGGADRVGADERADIHPVLGPAVDPATHQLEVRMGEDTFDGGAADATGCPLDHVDGHGRVSSRLAWDALASTGRPASKPRLERELPYILCESPRPPGREEAME